VCSVGLGNHALPVASHAYEGNHGGDGDERDEDDADAQQHGRRTAVACQLDPRQPMVAE
jgi:hypothetical protein